MAACVAGLLLAAGCSEGVPELPSLPAAPEIADTGTALEMAAVDLEEPAVCEDPDPAPPLAETGTVVAAAPVAPKPRAAARPRVETTDPPAAAHVPLEALLRTPHGAGRAPSPLDPRELDDNPVAAAPPPGVFEEWKDRVRVERHTEATGPTGPKQGSVSQTDAGVRVPVDDSVSLEGGVRVDQRDDPDAEAPVRKSMPRVGVEVRF
jgi:hypothetical protein